MKNVKPITKPIERGHHQNTPKMILNNDALTDMFISEYLEFKKLVTLTNEESMLSGQIVNSSDLEITSTTFDKDADEICQMLRQIAKSKKKSISNEEIASVKSLLLKSYFNDQPHTIKSLFQALQEIDQDKHKNVLSTLQTIFGYS